jgi:four helix bundle protein
MDAEQLKIRSKQFALNVIKLFQRLPKSDESKIIGKQLLRSSTSVAANYRAVCRARSQDEFYAKLCIVVEESDESLFWLEIIKESGIYGSPELNKLMQESEELLKIFSSSRKTAKINKTINK